MSNGYDGTVDIVTHMGTPPEPSDAPTDDGWTPNGCARCGQLERGHPGREGEYAYVAPSDALRLARMKARREARLNPPTRSRVAPDTYVTLTADDRSGDWFDALQYTLDSLALPPRPPEPTAGRFRGIVADRLGQRSVLAIGTPGAPGGIYDQYRRYASADTETQAAADYLITRYAQGREQSTLALTPQPPPDEPYPSRVRIGAGPWIPCRVVGFDFTATPDGGSAVVSGSIGEDGRLRLDRERHDPTPFEVMRNFEVTFTAARESLVALGPPFASAGEAMRGLRDVLDPELEAARDWEAQGKVCCHVCGPDPGHACDARATTTLRHKLPSGGMRELPLCGPCAAAESAAVEVGC